MRYILVLLFLFCGTSAYSQPWMYELAGKKTTKDFSFFEIQDAFNRYWDSKSIEKGKGFKQFKRWEYFMEQRVDSIGFLPYDIINTELLKLFDQQAHQSDLNTQWNFIGPAVVPMQSGNNKPGGIGRLNCIAFHPSDSNIIWVGSANGGLWKTSDGGNSWTTTTDALAAIGISDIAVNPKNPEIIYLATGDGDYGVVKSYSIGIIKSTDGGINWQATNLSHQIASQITFRKIIVNPDFPNVMLATSSQGIYGTADGWNSYSLVKSGHFIDIKYKPSNYAVVYATTLDYSGNAKVFRSTDGGSSFQESMTGMTIAGKVNRIELAVTSANPSVVYGLCSDASNNGFYALYKSTNSGASWSLTYDNSKLNLLGWRATGTDSGGQGTYDLSLAASPSDENEIYVGGVNVWGSTNGGKDWRIKGLWYHTDVIGYIHADHHMFIFNPHNGALFSANDGGIYKSHDKGNTWNDLSNGLAILQIYRMAHSEIDPGLIIAGNQDNGTVMLNAGEWKEIIGGDGMECFIDYDDTDIIYGTLYYGEIRKSFNGGSSFDSIAPPATQNGAWITPVVMHPKYPNVLYMGFQKVYKTINGGANWNTLADFQTGTDNLQAIAIAPSDDKILYIATRAGVYKSVDDGKSWTNITSGLPSNFKTSIAVSETNPNIVWVTVSGFTANAKVYISENGGETWSNYSGGLPNLPVNCIAYQNSSNRGLYVGTDIGVYYRDAASVSWVKYGTGLPNVSVYDLEILYSTGKLRAGTHGRGVWETDLYKPENEIYADFKLSSSNICVDGTITFYNHSHPAFDSLIWSFGAGANPVSAKGIGPHTVAYNSIGQKSVSLKGYKNFSMYQTTKTNIISVDNKIDFIVTPDKAAFCKGKTINLYASGGYNFTWFPSEPSDTLTGDKITISPEKDVTYYVEAKNGQCTVTKTVSLMVVSNDAVCDAILLHEGLNGPFSNVCATAEEGEPVPPKGSSDVTGCESQDGWCDGETRIDNSVWFTFIAPEGGTVSIDTDGFDNQIAVYDANSCNDLLLGYYNLLAANDDFPGKEDYAAVIQEISGLTPGKTYWLQVDGSYGGVTGTFTVKLNYYRYTGTENSMIINNSLNFAIFPNPNDGSFTLSYNLLEPGKAEIKIYAVTGKIVYFDEFQTETLSGQHSFTIGNLPSGFYIIELKCNNKISKQKIYMY